MNAHTTPSPTTGYSIAPGFLDAPSHAALLAFAIANEAKFQPSLVGGPGYDSATRASRSLRDLAPADAPLRERVRLWAPQLAAMLGAPAFQLATLEMELVAYGDGAYFRRHRDAEPGVERSADGGARVISAVYYFNAEPKAFTGGALRLYASRPGGGLGDFTDIEPRQNTLVAFPSETVHEVRPVACPSRNFANARFAINCWMHR